MKTNRLHTYLLTAFFGACLLLASCNKADEDDDEEDVSVPLKQCDDPALPKIRLYPAAGDIEGGGFQTEIIAEVQEGVEKIEIVTLLPFNDRLYGDTLVFGTRYTPMDEYHTEYEEDSSGYQKEVKYWRLPVGRDFSYNMAQTDTNYVFHVTYFCENLLDPANPIPGASDTINYQTGKLCDYHSYHIRFMDTEISEGDYKPSAPWVLTNVSFGVKFPVYLYERSNLVIFPTDNVKAVAKITGVGGYERIAPFDVELITEPLESDTKYYRSCLKSKNDINISQITGLSLQELKDDKYQIQFLIYFCNSEAYNGYLDSRIYQYYE